MKGDTKMYTVKQVITILKDLAEKFGSDLQFHTNFENGECEFGEAWDFIKKYNFYRSLHSRYLIDMYYSFEDKKFKVIRLENGKLIITQIEG